MASMGDNHRSEVDTSRPFKSVKEAIAIFSERILTGELHFPNYDYCGVVANISSPPPPQPLEVLVRRLGAELDEMKKDMSFLKERNLEVEVVMTSLDSQIQKNVSKLLEIQKCGHCRHSLGHALSIEAIIEQGFKREARKVKPIVPLIGDIFRSMKTMLNKMNKSV
ncbi:hypothetical protein ZOSMA_117G00170 [Zostera marina]|uniref:Uncharacterized protein n=1 Tax=Zostera marina TaxID=29655 RepID=A0A0K9Q203_ZOSMR|nr:hypothetical protein ZOSMA_117G00170 [Zostera marina]